jgi:TonB family protein
LNITKIFSELDQYIDRHSDLGANKTDKEGMMLFDSEEFKYAWYARIIKHKVMQNWFPSYAARILGVQGVVVVTFKIQSDGHVEDIAFQHKSGNESLDLAAINSVYGAKPFPSLPSDYQYEELGVRFLFGYNIRDFSQYFMERG